MVSARASSGPSPASRSANRSAAWSVLDTPATQLEAEARVLERALADSGECSVDLGGALAMLAEAGLVGVDGAGDGDVSTDR